MVPILVLISLVLLIVVDLIRITIAKRAANPSRSAKTSVDGISMPVKLNFHDAHLWVKEIDESTAVVGIDDFARRLVGDIDKIILPLEKMNVEEGETCVRVQKDKRVANLRTPLTGKILEVNKALKEKPSLLFSDPYGEGWLYKIRTWRLGEQVSGLLSGETAENWMEKTMQRLRIGLSQEVGMVAQDGGILHEDLSEHLKFKEWSRFVKEFLDVESSQL